MQVLPKYKYYGLHCLVYLQRSMSSGCTGRMKHTHITKTTIFMVRDCRTNMQQTALLRKRHKGRAGNYSHAKMSSLSHKVVTQCKTQGDLIVFIPQVTRVRFFRFSVASWLLCVEARLNLTSHHPKTK